MKKIIYRTTVILLAVNTLSIGESLDELGEIKLIDESEKSALFQRDKIVGCTDYGEQKELSCAKEPKEVILSKLPTSQQLEETNLEDEDARESMKNQLASILAELSQLKKEQRANRATIQQLKDIIKVLSDKKAKSTPSKITMVKRDLKEIIPKKSKTATLIRHKIKEISRNEHSAIIEVQKNESLSTYAQAYYNDNTKYYKIYKANRDKIPESMMIVIGTRLTIPLN